MIALIAFVASQAVPTSDINAGLQAALSRTESIANQTFDCMDNAIPEALQSHILDATPQLIVDSGLETCQQLKKDYFAALTGAGSVISKPDAQRMTDEWFSDVRKAYVENAEKVLTAPDLAESRVKTVLVQWRKCVVGKAVDWSRLQDEAATVGQASVTACNSFDRGVRNSLSYFYRSKGLPAAQAPKHAEKLENEMREIATETVISERAKALPRQP